MFCKNVTINGTLKWKWLLHNANTAGFAACGTNIRADSEN